MSGHEVHISTEETIILVMLISIEFILFVYSIYLTNKYVINLRELQTHNFNEFDEILVSDFYFGYPTTTNLGVDIVQIHSIYRQIIRNRNPRKTVSNEIQYLDNTQLQNISNNHKCSICLTSIKNSLDSFDNNEPVQLSECKHCYHYSCIQEWISIRQNCPLCRHETLRPTHHTIFF